MPDAVYLHDATLRDDAQRPLVRAFTARSPTLTNLPRNARCPNPTSTSARHPHRRKDPSR